MQIRRNFRSNPQPNRLPQATAKARRLGRFTSDSRQSLVAVFQERTRIFFEQFSSGKVYEAAGTARDTLAMIDQEMDGDAAFYLPAHSQWVDILLAIGQVRQAKAWVAQTHARYAPRLPAQSPLLAILYCDEAKAHFFSGEFLESARKAKIAAEIFCKCSDGFQALAPRALSRLSETQLVLGNLQEAEANIRLAIALAEKSPAPGVSRENCCLFILVRILVRQKEYRKAHDCLIESAKNNPHLERDRPLFFYEWLTYYGVTLHGLQHLEEAKTVFERALNLRQNVQGENTTSTLFVLGKLVQIAIQENQWERAEELQSRVVEISLRVHGPDSFQISTSLHNLAKLQARNGRALSSETESRAQEIEVKFIDGAVQKFRRGSLSELALFDMVHFAKPGNLFHFCTGFFVDFAEVEKFCPDPQATRLQQYEAIERHLAKTMTAQNVIAGQMLRYSTLGIYQSDADSQAVPQVVAVFMFVCTPAGKQKSPEALRGIFINLASQLFEQEVRPALPLYSEVKVFQSYMASAVDPFFARERRLYVQKDLCPGALSSFVWFSAESLGLAGTPETSSEDVQERVIEAVGRKMVGLQDDLLLRRPNLEVLFLPLSVTQEREGGFIPLGVMLSLTVAAKGTLLDRDPVLARARALYDRFIAGGEG